MILSDSYNYVGTYIGLTGVLDKLYRNFFIYIWGFKLDSINALNL